MWSWRFRSVRTRWTPDRSWRRSDWGREPIIFLPSFPEASSSGWPSPGTGALDYNTGKAILKLLQDTCRERGMTVVVITHNSAIAPMADRIIKIRNGRVSEMKQNEHPVSVETIEW